MKSSLSPGLKFSAQLPITPDLTVPQVSSRLPGFADMPPVFATAMMVAFVEETCIHLLAPHLETGEHSVGTHMDMSHIAATPIGLTVTAKVELVEAEKRKLIFRVTAEDEGGLIGEGIHHRAIILVDKFRETISKKAHDLGVIA